MDRGSLNANKDAVTNLQFAQCWSLDETGNWDNFRTDDNGDGSWNLNQNRTANKVNEISDITESTGPSWATPVYDAAGNMTTIPQPADPTSSYTATFDAWNRLVKLVDGANAVAEYEYDGANRRVINKTYSGATPSETRHAYFSPAWQVLEERVDADTSPNRQFVWGLRYIDDCVLRDQDTTGDATLDERLFAIQDANWNIVAIADKAGVIQERFSFSAYGEVSHYNSAFLPQVDSKFNWTILYAGYHFDTHSCLYNVRQRYLHAELGLWCSRERLLQGAGTIKAINNTSITLEPSLTIQNSIQNVVRKIFFIGLSIQSYFNMYIYTASNPIIYSDPLAFDRWMTFDWGHMYLVVEEWDENCEKTGRQIELHLGRHGWTKRIWHGLFGQIKFGHCDSDCKQDQALLDLWNDFAECISGDCPPNFLEWGYTCMSAMTQFFRYAGSYGPLTDEDCGIHRKPATLPIQGDPVRTSPPMPYIHENPRNGTVFVPIGGGYVGPNTPDGRPIYYE
jgi:hypothetical protein